MKTSTTGYKNNSKDKNEPILRIPSNSITTEGVNHNIIAIDDNGKITVMKPNKNYYFPDSESIIEIPMKQKGGTVKPNIQKIGNIEFDSNLAKEHPDGYLIVKDNKSGKDYGVIRKPDGKYEWYKTTKQKQEQLSKYGILPEQLEGRGTFSNRIYNAVNPAADYEINSTVASRVLFGTNRFENQIKERKKLEREVFGSQAYNSLKAFLERYGVKPIKGQEIDQLDALVEKDLQKNEKLFTDRDRKKLEKFYANEDSPFKKNYAKLKEIYSSFSEEHGFYSTERNSKSVAQEEDLFRMYLGLPQIKKTIGISEYSPTKAKDKTATYYKIQNDSLRNIVGKYAADWPVGKSEVTGYTSQETELPIEFTWTLGNFTISKGKDDKGEYVSYYDLWDLHPGGTDVNRIGKPLEVYDRIYMNELKKNQKQMGGKINISDFETYLSSLPEDNQDELLDYIDSMDEDAQIKFLMGGRTQWRKYQRGGLVPVEVEGEETILTNKGELYEFRGKKHAQGGIDVSLEEGSRIFSEHLKVDPNVASSILGRKTDKKLSYADLSKKFDTTKWIKILENPDADKYQKETARLKLANNQSMLDVIFTAQELQKEIQNKKKFQSGGEVGEIESLYPGALYNASTKGFNLSNYSDRFKKTKFNNVLYDPNTERYWFRTNDGRYKEHFKKGHNSNYDFVEQADQKNTDLKKQVPWNVQMNAVTGEFIIPPSFPDNLTPKASTTVLDIVAPTKSKPVGTLPQTTNPTKSRNSKTEPKSKPTDKPADNTYQFSKIQPFDKLETRPLSGVVSERGVPDISEYEVDPNTFEYDDSKVKKNNAFGIGSKLAGTILDIGLAMSDKLKVDPPQYRDLRKYPLFSRYVDFDDKEVGRVTALSIQQIQNSNMPEEVKQSRIADLMAQYKDYQAKIDFGNAQRYESKLMQDTEKLQNYVNANIDQQYQDMERYREKKARVDYLIDQFKAQRKSRIVNSIKSYADYVDRVNYQNQIYGDNYKVNPVTGKIQFTGATPDLLKQQEQQLAQYSQNSVPVQNLPGGAYMTRLPSGKEIIIDSTGKATVVN